MNNGAFSTGYAGHDFRQQICDKLFQIITSDEDCLIEECLFSVNVVNLPRGGNRRTVLNIAKNIHTKRCIVQIKNDDFMCGIYAALVGKSYHTNVILNDPLPENEIINLRKCRPTILNQLGVQMMDLLEDKLDFDG